LLSYKSARRDPFLTASQRQEFRSGYFFWNQAESKNSRAWYVSEKRYLCALLVVMFSMLQPFALGLNIFRRLICRESIL